jgi:hypothetical protein
MTAFQLACFGMAIFTAGVATGVVLMILALAPKTG